MKSYYLYFITWISLLLLVACVPLDENNGNIENSKIKISDFEIIKNDNFMQDMDISLAETNKMQMEDVIRTDKQESERFEKLSDDYIIKNNNGLNYSLTTYGTEYLEDGVVLILIVYNQNNEISWSKSWNRIDITELAFHSPVTVNKDTLYIVVDNTMYSFDTKTGEKYLEVKDVGSSEKEPLLDDSGKIYLISQIKPYITAVSKDGNVIWQNSHDSLLGAYDICLENNYLNVKTIGGEYTIDLNGKLLSKIQ